MDTRGVICVKKLSYMSQSGLRLKDISMDAYKGQIFGLLGPDGSGKTTMMKVLAGLAGYPGRFEGEASILDVPLKDIDTIRHVVGYVSQTRSLYNDMTVKGAVRLCSSLYKSWKQEAVENVLAEAEISVSSRICDMQEGLKCLLYLAITLGGSPRVLLIDEPMEGMDDLNGEILKSLLLEYIDTQGGTILAASGTIREMTGIVDRFAVLKNGSMLYCGNVDEAMEGYCKVRIVPRQKDTDFMSIQGVYAVESENRSILIKINKDKEKALELLGTVPNDFFDVMPMSFHEIYMEILKEEV